MQARLEDKDRQLVFANALQQRDAKRVAASEAQLSSNQGAINACLLRAVCQYQDVREGIGRVDGVACDSTAPAEKPAPWFSLFKRKMPT